MKTILVLVIIGTSALSQADHIETNYGPVEINSEAFLMGNDNNLLQRAIDSIIRKYNKYYRIPVAKFILSQKQINTEQEALFLAQNPQVVLALLRIYDLSNEYTDSLCPLDNQNQSFTKRTHNDERDAILHFIFSGLLTVFLDNENLVREYLVLREVAKMNQSSKNNNKGKIKNSMSVGEFDSEEIMDIHNNEEGIHFALSLREDLQEIQRYDRNLEVILKLAAKQLAENAIIKIENGSLIFFAKDERNTTCLFPEKRLPEEDVWAKFVRSTRQNQGYHYLGN